MNIARSRHRRRMIFDRLVRTGRVIRPVEAAFKPHFADVTRRAARRRRRTRAAGTTLAVVTAAAGGAAVVLPGDDPPGVGVGAELSPTPPFIPTPNGTPMPGEEDPKGEVKTGPMVVGDLDHLYLRWLDCREAGGCRVMVAATADGGVSWRSYPLPVGRDALVDLRAVGPRTLVAWSQGGDRDPARMTHAWHASTDGGATWREVTPRTVDAIPAGWQVPDGFEHLGGGILAVDPATGNAVTLPRNALRLAKPVSGLPAEAGLWVSGYVGEKGEPVAGAERIVGTGSAVEFSRDGGRTWQRHVFDEELTTLESQPGAAAIATADGRTVYAVGRAGSVLRIHRSVDGGRTWKPTAARQDVGVQRIAAAVVAGDRLVIQAGPDGGKPPLLFESTDGGASLRQIAAGPGASAVPVPGGYAQGGWPWSSGAWTSEDGTEWSYVAPPKLP